MKTYWLIEAPGQRWLAFAGWPYWTTNAAEAFAMCHKDQAEAFLNWVRVSDPRRFSFESSLAPAFISEHMNVEAEGVKEKP